MPIYTIECWYRYRGGDEKDVFDEDIIADTEEEAHEIALGLQRCVFKTTTLKIRENDDNSKTNKTNEGSTT